MLARTLVQTLGDLRQLERFSIRGNDVAYLPPEIGGLRQMTEFDIRENPKLSHLPLEMGRMESLKVSFLSFGVDFLWFWIIINLLGGGS